MVNQSDLVNGAKVTIAGFIDNVQVVEKDDFSYVSCCVFIDNAIGARNYIQVPEDAILSAEAPTPEAPDCEHVTMAGEVLVLEPGNGSWISQSYHFDSWAELYEHAKRWGYSIQKLVLGEFV